MDKPNSILPMVYDRISSKELLNSQIIASLLDIIKANQRKQSSIDEKYNIFYALRIWQKEVTLHSRILTDMLRVDGYHGLKAEPLKAFVDMLPENYKFQCDEKVEVTDEKVAGDMRRVDIFLKDANGQVIIIENKIYAGDQDKQLMDYHKFGKEQSAKNKKPIVLYLTLGGAQPSSASCGDLKDNEDYFCISYRDLIHNWIEGCIEMAEKSEKVALREVLHQYNQVIEYLVKKDMKNVNEILEKITNQEDYEALNELAATVGSIQATVQSVFLEKLEKALKPTFPKLYKKEGKQIIWCKIDPESSDNGLCDWFSIKESGVRLWCSLNVCKDNAYGKFLDLEPTRKEKFAKVYTESGIRADCNASDFWFWLDEEVNINFEDFKTIKDILDSNQPVAVKATAAVITNLLNSYTQIDAI